MSDWLMRALAAYGEMLFALPHADETRFVTVPDDLSELAERWPEAFAPD
ncbi:hypothetical protein [Nonomuraea zeae]|nr:hypothetical protein [Nonomuraea zeae]